MRVVAKLLTIALKEAKDDTQLHSDIGYALIRIMNGNTDKSLDIDLKGEFIDIATNLGPKAPSNIATKAKEFGSQLAPIKPP